MHIPCSKHNNGNRWSVECVELVHHASRGIVNLSVARAVAKKLIDAALEEEKREKADNLSVVTIFICAENLAQG